MSHILVRHNNNNNNNDDEDVTVLWNQGVGLHTEGEVMANRPDIIIKNRKRENVDTDRCGNISGQNCHAKGSRKGKKYKSLELQGM
jgi:hypothetical protein